MILISSVEGLREWSVNAEGNLAATLTQVRDIKATTMELQKRGG